MVIYTIGFTKKSAEKFFEILRKSGAKHLLDIRLNNKSQLAGFTKKDDLGYFLKHLVNMEYHQAAILAPDEAIIKEYRKTRDWRTYEEKYLSLLKDRQIEREIETRLLEEGAVLLCSEHMPNRCHRRLAAEYLATCLKPREVSIVHLLGE